MFKCFKVLFTYDVNPLAFMNIQSWNVKSHEISDDYHVQKQKPFEIK